MPTPADTLRAAAELLADTDRYLGALHTAVARHDNLGADLTCAGCQLHARISPTLAAARELLSEAQQPPAGADEQEPTQLRWGLDDVMWGDDDTTTIMLSGPAGEPYWLELDPERTAALRDNLAGPGAEEQQPSVLVSVTRYTVSVLPADDINHRYFALSVELTPRGWIVTDGHSGYDADGVRHHGKARWHPFADYDDALAVARRLAPGLTVNGHTATDAYHRTHPAP